MKASEAAVMVPLESWMMADQRALGRVIESTAWGLFFVWVGIALLANVGWGVGLIGVGVITVGAQAWRKHVGVNTERFSVMVRVVFVIAGIWSLFDLRVDLVPLLFIAAGGGLLASTWRTRHSQARNRPSHP